MIVMKPYTLGNKISALQLSQPRLKYLGLNLRFISVLKSRFSSSVIFFGCFGPQALQSADKYCGIQVISINRYREIMYSIGPGQIFLLPGSFDNLIGIEHDTVARSKLREQNKDAGQTKEVTSSFCPFLPFESFLVAKDSIADGRPTGFRVIAWILSSKFHGSMPQRTHRIRGIDRNRSWPWGEQPAERGRSSLQPPAAAVRERADSHGISGTRMEPTAGESRPLSIHAPAGGDPDLSSY